MLSMNRLFSVFILLFPITALSQDIKWSIKPIWDNVTFIGAELLTVEKDGKKGVVDYSGRQIVPYDNHEFTAINEERFLVLNREGKILSIRNSLGEAIRLRNHKYNPLNSDIYADINWPYYSQGLLPVKGNNGLWGCLNLQGILTIDFKYLKVYPFCYNQAAVCYKNGYWGLIRTNGEPVYGNKKLRSKTSFVSSYTSINDRILSLVCADNRLYLVNGEGQIQEDIFHGESVPLGNNSIVELDADNFFSHNEFTMKVNSIGEIVYIKDEEKIFKGQTKTEKVVNTNPISSDIVIGENGLIQLDSIRISSQFQNVIVIGPEKILVKMDGKWGIMSFNRSERYMVEVVNDMNDNHNEYVNFSIKGIKSNSNRAYVTDHLGIIRFIEITNDTVKVPIGNVHDGVVSLGLEIDGIRLEPRVYQIPQIKRKNVSRPPVTPPRRPPTHNQNGGNRTGNPHVSTGTGPPKKRSGSVDRQNRQNMRNNTKKHKKRS